MPPVKSMLKKALVDEVKKSHKCQHNSRHRLQKGEKRLGIKTIRNFEYFCTACAIATIDADIRKLESLRAQLVADEPET